MSFTPINLTQKQASFARELIRDPERPTDCAIRAGYSGKRENVAKTARKLREHPDVLRYIARLGETEVEDGGGVMDAEGAALVLSEIARNGGNAMARKSAASELLRLHGGRPGPDALDMSEAELDREILAQMRALAKTDPSRFRTLIVQMEEIEIEIQASAIAARGRGKLGARAAT